MEKLKLERLLDEIGGVSDREFLVEIVTVGNEHIKRSGKLDLNLIYDEIGQDRKMTQHEVQRKLRITLDMMCYHGDASKVTENFGTYKGRIHITPTRFVKVMADRFG